MTALEMLEAGDVAERVAFDPCETLGEGGDLNAAEIELFKKKGGEHGSSPPSYANQKPEGN